MGTVPNVAKNDEGLAPTAPLGARSFLRSAWEYRWRRAASRGYPQAPSCRSGGPSPVLDPPERGNV